MFTTEPGKPQRLLFDVKSKMIAEGRIHHLSRVLSTSKIGLQRVDFDPNDSEHRLIFTRFLAGHGWRGGVTFHIESPHLTVPSTCINKLLTLELQREMQQVAQEDQIEAELAESAARYKAEQAAIRAEQEAIFDSAP